MRYRHHHVAPEPSSARILLVYKNFAANRSISHIGLGVSARNTAAVLNRQGYWADVWAIQTGDELTKQLAAAVAAAAANHEAPISHVNISAPWVPTATLAALAMKYPTIVFTISSHSNVGFLQADANGTKLLRESYDLSHSFNNVRVAGNCRRYTDWVERSFNTRCYFLPNLYDLGTTAPQPQPLWGRTSPLRIGCFGATRPYKNMITAAAATIELGKTFNVDVEFWYSGGRTEGGNVIIAAVQNMMANLPRAKLVEKLWSPWPDFRRTIASMNVLMQPSFTESFNMVTADGIAEGVPSVVSDAIDWVPKHWVADADDADHVAKVAVSLLSDQHAAVDGWRALSDYIEVGTTYWSEFLLEPFARMRR